MSWISSVCDQPWMVIIKDKSLHLWHNASRVAGSRLSNMFSCLFRMMEHGACALQRLQLAVSLWWDYYCKWTQSRSISEYLKELQGMEGWSNILFRRLYAVLLENIDTQKNPSQNVLTSLKPLSFYFILFVQLRCEFEYGTLGLMRPHIIKVAADVLFAKWLVCTRCFMT